MTPDPLKKLIYTGQSMNPTLKEPDILFVFPCHDRKIRRGDVIVFQIPGSERTGTHRVISTSRNGIRTRGDNNPKTDPYILKPEALIGVVDYVQRGKKIKRLAGGSVGYVFALLLRFDPFPILGRLILKLLFPLYDRMSRLGLMRRIAPLRIQPQVYAFHTRDGVEMQLFIGSKPVGRRPAGDKSWQIKRPYRLLIDESSLPE